MKNKDWYYYDEKEMRCKLTKKAPKKAIESYRCFYEMLDKNIDDEI